VYEDSLELASKVKDHLWFQNHKKLCEEDETSLVHPSLQPPNLSAALNGSVRSRHHPVLGSASDDDDHHHFW